MRAMSPWHAALACITGVLAVASGYTSLLTLERQRAIIETTRYNLVFDMSQTATEMFRLEGQVGRYLGQPSNALADDVQLRYAIFLSRLQTMKASSFRSLFVGRPEAATVETLTESLGRLGPAIDHIEEPGTARTILHDMALLDRPMLTLVSAANGTFSDRVETDRQHLRGANQKGLWLTIALVLCGIVLVLMLIRRNRTVIDLAHRDPLTDLPNRLRFRSKLAALAAEGGSASRLVVMLLDVDLFKHVNDTFGHAGGDALLRSLAEKLRTLRPDTRLIARLGGDEFAILLTSAEPERDATRLADAIGQLRAQPFSLEGQSVSTSLSIGIVVANHGPCDADALFRNADVALYAAKAAGRGTYRIFDPGMEMQIRVRREMEAELRAAIRDDRLALEFQPIVDLRSGRIVSFEALVRWPHARRGPVPPVQFIPLAEETGLIGALGTWVLRRACAVAAQWPADVRVSVNLSPYQFDGTSLATEVADVLASTRLDATRLELEITESVLLRDTEQVRQTLATIKAIGVRIALDDFGSGYSSLGYLTRFPIDKIKIDQSFVREITADAQSALIVESIGGLARKLGLTTTAEGIETEAHAALVQAMGYVEGQGYFFARPLSVADCNARILAQDAQLAAA